MKHPIGQKSASHEFTIWFHAAVTLENRFQSPIFVWMLLDPTRMTPSKSVSKKKRPERKIQ